MTTTTNNMSSSTPSKTTTTSTHYERHQNDDSYEKAYFYEPGEYMEHLSNLVKTTLGPKGLDKMLQKVDPTNSPGAALTVTNDGATILRSIHIDNAAAKVLVDIAKVQDEQVGDGTTSVAVLGGELLRQAEALEQEYRLHPQTIATGWRLARTAARTALEDHATQMEMQMATSNDTATIRHDST